MEFTFKTEYNQKALSVMGEALRKTIRKKYSRRSHIFGWIVLILGLLFTWNVITGDAEIQMKTVITWIASAVLFFVLIFEDKLNGYIAKKRMLTGENTCVTTFDDDKYISTTGFGKSEFKYDIIQIVAENSDYFVFIFDRNHAQLYDKKELSGGTAEDFRAFITEKTGKEVIPFGK